MLGLGDRTGSAQDTVYALWEGGTVGKQTDRRPHILDMLTPLATPASSHRIHQIGSYRRSDLWHPCEIHGVLSIVGWQ